MGIRFACHGCDKRLNVKRDLAGKRGVCPDCSTRFRIPHQDTERSTPIELEVETAVSHPPLPMDRAAPTEPVAEANIPSDPQPESTSSLDLMVDDPTSTWYVRPPTGGQYGPASSEVLHSWIDQGRVASTSLLWRD